MSDSASFGLAAFCIALAPAIIHLSASGSDPFYFNLIIRIVQILLIVLFLWVSSKSANEAGKMSFRWRDHWSYFSLNKDSTGGRSADIRHFRFSDGMRNLWKIPLLWGCIGTFDFSFFIWASQYVETAIAATILELASLWLIFVLVFHERTDSAYRRATETSRASIRKRCITLAWLMLPAAIGVFLLYLSQKEALSFADMRPDEFSEWFGLLLAAVGTILSVATVGGSLIYGKLLYYRHTERCNGSIPEISLHHSDRSQQFIMLRLTLLGFVVSKLFSLPLLAAMGALPISAHSGVDSAGFLGAIAMGVAVFLGGTLLRQANIKTSHPEKNALMLASPVIALLILGFIGISLARFELFAIGVLLILSVNVFAQRSGRPTVRL